MKNRIYQTKENATEKQLKYWESLKNRRSNVFGMRWKIKDTSKMKGRKGVKSYNWKGNNASYCTIHCWLKRWKIKSNHCENPNCIYPRKDRRGNLMIKPSRLEWANVDHKYKRKLEDYILLCTPCHRNYDKKFINEKNIYKN